MSQRTAILADSNEGPLMASEKIVPEKTAISPDSREKLLLDSEKKSSSSSKKATPLLKFPTNQSPAFSPLKPEGGSLMDKILFCLRIFLVISSLLIFSKIITAMVKDEFSIVTLPDNEDDKGSKYGLTVPKTTWIYGLSGQYDMKKMCSEDKIEELKSSYKYVKASNKDEYESKLKRRRLERCLTGDELYSLMIQESLGKYDRGYMNDMNDDDSYPRKITEKELTKINKKIEKELKEEMFSFMNRKTWAQWCLVLMILATIAEVAVIALAIGSFIISIGSSTQQRKIFLIRIMMMVLIAVSLLILIFLAITIGLYQKRSSEYEINAKFEHKKELARVKEHSDSDPHEDDWFVFSYGTSISNLADSIILCIANMIIAAILLVKDLMGKNQAYQPIR